MKTRNLRNLAKRKTGPGTTAYRLSTLLDNLDERYPDPDPFSAKAPEPRYLQMIDDDRLSLRTALQEAITALDDWLNIYAEELCDPKRVEEAKERVYSRGTLAYITDVRQRCEEALHKHPPSEEDDQDLY